MKGKTKNRIFFLMWDAGLVLMFASVGVLVGSVFAGATTVVPPERMFNNFLVALIVFIAGYVLCKIANPLSGDVI